MPQLSETSASQSQGVPSCGENTITGTIRSAKDILMFGTIVQADGEKMQRNNGGWG